MNVIADLPCYVSSPLVTVQNLESTIAVRENETMVELSCEMTNFIREDEDFQWFVGEQQITGRTNNRTITYTNGTPDAAQKGDNFFIPGRVSILTISNPRQADAGTYTCRVQNTTQSANIQLDVQPLAPTDSKWLNLHLLTYYRYTLNP